MLRITNGRNGGLVAYDAGGEIIARVESEIVVSAKTNSWEVAELFTEHGPWIAVDHDRDEIFAYTAGDEQLAKRDETPNDADM